jgi:hypothetical protein
MNIIERIEEYSKQEYQDELDLEKLKFPESSLELNRNVITLLSIPHLEDDRVCIRARSGAFCEVELDIHSGSIFNRIFSDSRISIYLGTGSYVNATFVNATFLVIGDNGISYWDNIRSFDDAVKYGELYLDVEGKPITLLQNVSKRIKLLNFSNVMKKHQDASDKASDLLSDSMDILSDAVIQCNDGDVKIVRYMLAKDSEFFLHMFRYAPESRVFKLNFDKIIVQTYIDYLLNLFGARDMSYDKICEEVSTMIEFGVFVQDFHFVRGVYMSVSERCDKETLDKLNEQMKELISFD